MESEYNLMNNLEPQTKILDHPDIQASLQQIQENQENYKLRKAIENTIEEVLKAKVGELINRQRALQKAYDAATGKSVQ
jgi:hypothetical protein